MAWLGMIFLSTWIRKSAQFVMSGSFLFLPPYTEGEKKKIWSELESNPGPLDSQATTRPWLLGPQACTLFCADRKARLSH